jgi:hypothetical protein
MAELNPPILGYGLPMGLKWLTDKFKAHHMEIELDIPEGLELHFPRISRDCPSSARGNC